jgi:hypothetical protein
VGDPRFTAVDKLGSVGASAGGAAEEVRSPVLVLLQVCVFSDDGTRWGSVVARLPIPHPRIGGSVLCSAPWPDPVRRRIWIEPEVVDDEGWRCCGRSRVEALRSSRSDDFPSTRGHLPIQGSREDAVAARHRHVLFLAGDIELQRVFTVISILFGCLSVISVL